MYISHFNSSTMASNFLKTMFLVLVLLCCFRCGKSDLDQLESLKSTIVVVRQVIDILSIYNGHFVGDPRLNNAVFDCLDLMDLSVDQLNLTINAYKNVNGTDNSTGNIGADMKTWLSGALINQDTCIQGFDGNPFVQNIAQSLNQITNFVSNILSNVKTTPINHTFPSRNRNLLQAANGNMVVDSVVSLDGTGNFTTIGEAIEAAPKHSARIHVIYVKKGVYNEYVEIDKNKWNIMMIGDGVNATVISGNRSFIDGWTTYRSATFAVKGRGFIARDITFENTAGPEKHQAVAFRSDSDLSVLYRCAFRGYQDTLYAHSQRQFYRECLITGTVDFIFGDGTVVFQNCQIEARQGLPNQKNTITAQGRKELVEDTGFSIQFCNISVDSDVSNSTQTYLGRPWKEYSRTVIMQSYISNAIRPEGWLEWNGDFALDSLFYGEYSNYGPGSVFQNRVKWPGYRVLNSSAQANNFTVSRFIIGNEWLPPTGVKYSAGLQAV